MAGMGTFWAPCICAPLFLHGYEGCRVADGKQYGTPLPGQMCHGASQWARRETEKAQEHLDLGGSLHSPTNKQAFLRCQEPEQREGNMGTGLLDGSYATSLSPAPSWLTDEVSHLPQWVPSITAPWSASLRPVPTWACHGLLHSRTFPPLRGQPG